jgi:hypothetical protein
MIMPENTSDSLEGGLSASKPLSFENRVKQGIYSPIRIRFDAALGSCKKIWPEVYHEAGISKHYASQIRNGHIIPPYVLRIKIASIMGVDTSVLWRASDLLDEEFNVLLKEAGVMLEEEE